MLNVTTPDDLRKLIKESKYVVVDFYTATCVPCKIMEPVITKLSDDPRFAGVSFVKLNPDVWDCTEEWSIKAVPTIICFKDGLEVGRQLGTCPQKQLESLFESMLLFTLE